MSDRNIEHQAIGFYVLIVLLLVLFAVLSRRATAQERPDWGMTELAAGQLARDWQRATASDSTACLYGHRDANTIVIDSAPRLARDCRGYFGAAAFLRTSLVAGTEPVIVAMIVQSISHAPEWQFLAVVYGVNLVRTPDGRRALVPQFLYAFRQSNGLPTSTPSEDGP